MASQAGRHIINAYGRRVPVAGVPEPSLPIGPATYILGAACGAGGALGYALEGQQAREFQLGAQFALRPFNVIDTLRAAWLLDPGTHHLTAVCGFGGGPTRIFFFGEFWGTWIDDKGARQRSQDPVAMMKHFKIPIYFEPRTFQFGCEFNINTSMREGFSDDARRAFQPGTLQHQLALLFETPIGNFCGARMHISDRNSAGGGWSIGIDGFPLRWPRGGARAEAPPPPPPASQPGAAGFGVPYGGTRYVYVESASTGAGADEAAPKMKLRPREGEIPPAPEPTEAATSKLKLKPKAPAPDDGFGMPEVLKSETPTAPRISLRPRPPQNDDGPSPARVKLRASSSPSAPPPAPEPPEASKGHLTAPVHQMPVSNLLATIDSKPTSDEQWKIIESNLMLRRSERTYPLLSRYADLIAERTLAWPSSRLRSVFGDIPGGVLIGVMYDWHVSQILAVAEGNPEEARILDWLRDRETERLMLIDPGLSVSMPESARRLLRVDRNADAAAIDRVCRTLILFLEMTGDKSTRMMSRKTEELAERLFMARDVLIRNIR